jgi:hypothetical protein
MRTSTGKPTKEEAARIVAAKEGPCMACEVWFGLHGARCDYEGCDYNHCKSGNIRRGHLFGYALCAHHHRAVPIDGVKPSVMRVMYGPSMMDGSRLFHETYGDDFTLIAMQTATIKGKL